jgi:DNA mismatch endonuclease (patch repair protein)
MMAAIRSRNTTPELQVRKVLRSLGVGYWLHVSSLPGRPDIVMRGRRRVIEVRGCFWHRHENCKFAYTPKSNVDFWIQKFSSNVDRDRRNEAALIASGWRVLTVWECEAADPKVLRSRIEEFLAARSK